MAANERIRLVGIEVIKMNEWHEREVAFFGKITAGITHEIRNVLAIIKESSGLVEDIMAMSPEDSIPHQEKIGKSLSNIKRQVQRGIDVTARLNKFAHSTDKKIEKIDLCEMVEQLGALTRRFASLKHVAIETGVKDLPIAVVTDPIRFQMALLACIESCLDLMQGGQITICLRKKEEQNLVQVICEGDLLDKDEFSHNLSTSELWPSLQKMANRLGGTVEPDESACGILLSLPEKI